MRKGDIDHGGGRQTGIRPSRLFCWGAGRCLLRAGYPFRRVRFKVAVDPNRRNLSGSKAEAAAYTKILRNEGRKEPEKVIT